MTFFRRSVLPSMALFLISCSGIASCAESPIGSNAYLVESGTNGAVVVFVPSGAYNGNYLIATREDVVAYRKWAEESHPGKTVVLQWDVVPFELDVAETNLLACLREGDEGVEPSGRFRFAVTNLVPASGKVSLVLKNPPAPKDFAPDCCASNVWILSRDKLFDRWGECISTGGVASVRASFRDLNAMGRFDCSPEWRAAADAFEATSGVRAVVRFRNENRTPVRVRIGETTQILPGGEPWEWNPGVDFRPGTIEWEVRDFDPDRGGTDDDWEWDAGVVQWMPLGDDANVPLVGKLGRPKPLPFLKFPDGAVPDELEDAALFIEAMDESEHPISGATLVIRDGRRGLEMPPGIDVRTCRLRAEGWDDAEFVSNAGTLSRGMTGTLSGKRMKKSLPPWKDGIFRIEWNGFEGEARLRIDAGTDRKLDERIPAGVEQVSIPLSRWFDGDSASETNIVISWMADGNEIGCETNRVRRGVEPDAIEVSFPPPPVFPEPDDARIVEAKNWFSDDNQCPAIRGGKSIEYYAKLWQKTPRTQSLGNFAVAKKYQLRLLGFRPAGEKSDDALRRSEETFDQLVASIENGSSSPLPAVARAFQRLLPNGKDIKNYVIWPPNKDFEGFVKVWWKDECRPALSSRSDASDKLSEARSKWNGLPGRGWNSMFFAEAYVHILCCPGCNGCRPFRDAMLAAETFEARRAALFRALMLWNKKEDDKAWSWGAIPPPTEDEVKAILNKFREKSEGSK